MIEALTNLDRLVALAVFIAVSLKAYGRTRNPGFLVLLFTLFVWPLVLRAAAEAIVSLESSRGQLDAFVAAQFLSLLFTTGLLILSVLLLASSRLTFPGLRR